MFLPVVSYLTIHSPAHNEPIKSAQSLPSLLLLYPGGEGTRKFVEELKHPVYALVERLFSLA